MGDTMMAGRMNYVTKHFEVKEVPVPEPGPNDVRVRVKAAGVCLSDVHLIQTGFKPPLLGAVEVTMGHEVAGIVDKLGAEVRDVEVGSRVTMESGRQVGMTLQVLGIDYDGGWAEYVVTPASTLVPIPDNLPFEQAAIIPDAVSTPWSAITWTGKILPGEAVGVWGIGGLGTHAVQLLRFAGAAPIVAVDPSPGARQRALEFGADLALDPGQIDLTRQILTITEGEALNAALDFAGEAASRKQALNNLRFGGRLVLAGISGGPITVENDGLFLYARRQILGHYGYDRKQLVELVKLAKLGRLDFSRSVSRTYPLADAAQAVDDLDSKVGDPIRLVLVP